jgi:hypothetical protein
MDLKEIDYDNVDWIYLAKNVTISDGLLWKL